ncbi:MAG: GNAT family N-acetyltransferase [Ruminococcaceae bacterium]|nr:GNAT family N-acetyltransferase [Oscillospiraceae bacterium]
MHLTYHNLTIRNATTADASTLAAWWNDGGVMAHAGFPLGLGTTPEKIAADLSTDRDDTRRRLILELSGTPIGEMSYRNLGNGTAEIGIKICDTTKQEKGLGRKYLSLLITALFDKLGYYRIFLDTNLKNTRAQHVYESLGFRKIRILENNWKDQLGVLQSTVEYELFPDAFLSYID